MISRAGDVIHFNFHNVVKHDDAKGGQEQEVDAEVGSGITCEENIVWQRTKGTFRRIHSWENAVCSSISCAALIFQWPRPNGVAVILSPLESQNNVLCFCVAPSCTDHWLINMGDWRGERRPFHLNAALHFLRTCMKSCGMIENYCSSNFHFSWHLTKLACTVKLETHVQSVNEKCDICSKKNECTLSFSCLTQAHLSVSTCFMNVVWSKTLFPRIGRQAEELTEPLHELRQRHQNRWSC